MNKLNIIYNEECIEGMKKIEDKSIDLILCYLPYGTTSCSLDVIIPFDKLWEQYNRIIKDNGAICLFGSEPFSSYLRMSNIKNYRFDFIWEKNTSGSFALAKKRPMQYHELISVFYKKQPIYNPQFGKYADKTIRKNVNVIQNKQKTSGANNIKKIDCSFDFERGCYPKMIIKIPTENRNKRIHPTQKSVEIMEYLIKTYTNEGDVVLDNCIGSGTTAIACINTNRNYIGFENNEEYYKISLKRIEDVKAKI